MAENTQERLFAPGVFIKRKSFGKGKGEIITQSINWEEFKAFAEEHVNERGYINIDIKTSKNDKDKLYAEVNTWQPDTTSEDEGSDNSGGDEDGLPF